MVKRSNTRLTEASYKDFESIYDIITMLEVERSFARKHAKEASETGVCEISYDECVETAETYDTIMIFLRNYANDIDNAKRAISKLK